MKESEYQSILKHKIRAELPGALVIKSDPSDIQGFPDLIIFFEDKWASLEVKRNKKASKQPNQEYYVMLMDGMSFSSFIYPENEREVLDGLYAALRTTRETCIPKS